MFVYRASSLGSCVRALVATRKGERKNETPEMVQGWYDRGVVHENDCLFAMESAGWNLQAASVLGWVEDEGQPYFEIPIADDVVVTGHLDGLGFRDDEKTRVIEIKAPNAYQRVYDAAMTGDWSDPYVSKVAWQVSAYSVATGMEVVLACLDEGGVQTHIIEVPPYSLEDIRKRVLSVEFMVETGVMPECNQRDFPCPFFPRVCSHQQDEVAFDPVLDQMADDQITDIATRKIVDDRIAERRLKILAHLDTRDTVTTDNYKVTRYTTKRTSLDKKALDIALDDAGMSLSAFETVSESIALKVTSREKDDAE